MGANGTSPMIEELRPRPGNSLFPKPGQSLECRSGDANEVVMDLDAALDTSPAQRQPSSPPGGNDASPRNNSGAIVLTPPRSPSNNRKQVAVSITDGWKKRVRHLQQALAKLSQVDRILGGFSMFWDHMETSVSLLSQRNEHVESLLSFTKNPKLRQRFFDRLDEYANMWLAVQMASRKYSSSERTDDRSRRRHNASGTTASGKNRDSRGMRDGSYNFLQL